MTDGSVFAALAEPTRRQLLPTLADSGPERPPSSPRTIQSRAKVSSSILHILKDAGLVAVHRQGREKRYTLAPEPLVELKRWLNDLSVRWVG